MAKNHRYRNNKKKLNKDNRYETENEGAMEDNSGYGIRNVQMKTTKLETTNENMVAPK